MDHIPGLARVAVVGGGPAGLAPLLAAHNSGRLEALLHDGVAIIEQSAHLGAGAIGNYAINSDSSGRTFTDCLGAEPAAVNPQAAYSLAAKPHGAGSRAASPANAGELARLAHHPLTRQLTAAGDGAVRLRDAGTFLGLVGDAVGEAIARHPASRAFTNHRALSAQRCEGAWCIQVQAQDAPRPQILRARHLVIATGAEQPATRLAQELVGGFNLAALAGDRLLQSGDVLKQGGLDHVMARLSACPNPRIAIIGGSTSAAAVAHALLNRLPGLHFGDAAITLLHRRPLRIYYPDRAAALAEGYDEWTEDDVCPVSNRVYRFAGFRLDSRELIMQVRGIGGRPAEPRMRLHHLQDNDTEAAAIIGQADLVIAAMGYRPRALPLLDARGDRIALLAETGAQMAMVDGQCRVLDDCGLPIPDVFGIGLAAGFLPRGALGGEPSFRGQANGLWLWQHDVGALIVDAVTSAGPEALSGADAATPPQPAAPTGGAPRPVTGLPETQAAEPQIAWPLEMHVSLSASPFTADIAAATLTHLATPANLNLPAEAAAALAGAD